MLEGFDPHEAHGGCGQAYESDDGKDRTESEEACGQERKADQKEQKIPTLLCICPHRDSFHSLSVERGCRGSQIIAAISMGAKCNERALSMVTQKLDELRP
jgi:hypothetical protein